MEVKVGFRQDSDQYDAKAIVYTDNETCYLRNFTSQDKLTEILDPEYFISNIALLIDHENLHLILDKEVGEEANSSLNNIDGFMGYLNERRVSCYVCKKRIYDKEPCMVHAGLYWHKQCLKEFEETEDYKKLWEFIHKFMEEE